MLPVVLLIVAATDMTAHQAIAQPPGFEPVVAQQPQPKGATGMVTGVVSDGGGPVGTNMEVRAFDDIGIPVAATRTNPLDGTYSFTLQAGDYVFLTTDSTGSFGIAALHDGTPCLGGPFNSACDVNLATPINVPPAGMVTVDIDLVDGGRIDGEITERTTGFHARFPMLHFFDPSGQPVVSASPTIFLADITYRALSLPAGSYFLVVDMPGFVPVLHPNLPCPGLSCDVTSGGAIAITAGVLDTGFDFSIDVDPAQGGAIAGTVEDQGASPDSGTVAVFNDAQQFAVGSASAFSRTGILTNGYIVAGLPAGTVYARTQFFNAVDELYDNFACEDGCEPTLGTPIQVAAGQVTQGINFVIGDGMVDALPSTAAAGDRFGAAVAASGNRVVVGQPNANGGSGQVVVFRREGSALVEEQVLTVPPEFFASGFGGSIAIEGDQLLIGAEGTDPGAKAKGQSPLQAALLQRLGQSWDMKFPFASSGGASDDRFGAAVALSGDMVVIGAPGDAEGEGATGSGAFYVFDGVGGAMVTKQKPLSANPGALFGSSLSASGHRIAAGAPNGQIQQALGGVVELYQMVGQNLQQAGSVQGSGVTDGDGFGTSIALDGDTLAIGAPGDDSAVIDGGAAYVFNFSGASEQQILTPSQGQAGESFGSALAIGANGFAVGAPGRNDGSVYRFDASFNQTQRLDAEGGDVGFGSAVAIGSGILAIGAPDTASAAGVARVQIDDGRFFSSGFE